MKYQESFHIDLREDGIYTIENETEPALYVTGSNLIELFDNLRKEAEKYYAYCDYKPVENTNTLLLSTSFPSF